MTDKLYDGPCVAGCQHFHGGEIRHHKDCGHYPESLTRLNADRIEALTAERDRLAAQLKATLDREGEGQKKLSVRALSRLSGVSVATVHRFLTGHDVHLSTAAKLRPHIETCPCCGNNGTALEALTAELTEAQAQIAAAYEDAAETCEAYPRPYGRVIAEVVRSAVPAEASAALDTLLREAERRGAEKMREAAAREIEPSNPPDDWTQYARDCSKLAKFIRDLDINEVLE